MWVDIQYVCLNWYVLFIFMFTNLWTVGMDVWLIWNSGLEKHGKDILILLIKMGIYSYLFQLVTFKILSIWCNTPIKTFFPRLKTVFELIDSDAFSACAVLLFHLFHISKMFPFEDLFSSGKQKKNCSGHDLVNREGGAQGSCHFWSKTSEHSAWCGQVHL